MMKLKRKAVDRIKRRYLLISAESKDQVEKTILDYVGILGYARANPFFVKVEKGNIILAVERSSLDEVRAAFEISKENIKVLKVSGTLKGLEK